MKKFILLVLCFAVTLKVMSDPMPDLVPIRPDGWSAPLVCSMNEGSTTSDYILKKGIPVYVKFAVKNSGDKKVMVDDYVVMVDGQVVLTEIAPEYLNPGDTFIYPTRQFTFDSTGVHTVTGMIDYDEDADEINENNNTYSIDCLWIENSGEGINLSLNDEIVDVSFTPFSFDDLPGDVNDPLGCVFVDNLFLAGFSPEQIEEGDFSYIDNPEMNQYVKNILHDLGPCSLYVFLEGNIDGEKYNYSEAAEINISEDNYQKSGDARVWRDLKYYTRERYDTLRVAREIIETKGWNFKADLTLPHMGFSLSSHRFPIPEEEVCEPSSFIEPFKLGGEGTGELYSGGDLPDSFDWRDVGGTNWMTSVKNQTYVYRDDAAGIFRGRYYGACYIMGVFGAAEAFYNIQMENDPDFDLDLSEQHYICKYGNENPMPGGFVWDVLESLGLEGFVAEECCPYRADKAQIDPTDCDLCEDWESKVVKIPCCRKFSGAFSLEERRNTIKEHLMETPLAFGVTYTDDETFKLTYGAYTEGFFPLFYGADEGAQKHLMVLIGWGNDGGEDYWIVKNSSGLDWGYNGYIKMKMADNVDDCIKSLYQPFIKPPKVEMLVANPNDGSEWHSVDFPFLLPDIDQYYFQNFSRFADPIVVMCPPSYMDTGPVTVRVKDVTYEGFKFQLDEWNYQDGTHEAEIVPYLVVEKGAHVFGGMKFEARKIESLNDDWETIELKDGFFSESPVILTQVVTRNGDDAVVTRVRNVSVDGFEIKLQGEQANSGGYLDETVHYIAISQGSAQIDGKDFVAGKTSNSVTDDWYTINFDQSLNEPVVLANMNTADGTDPCVLRYKNPGNSSIEVKVEEERSYDTEVNHTSEVVGYVVVSGVGGGTDRLETPSSLNAILVTPTGLDLVWQGVGGSKGYEVERKEGLGSFSRTATVGGTEYRDNGLEPGETYTYRVRAYNYGGYSEYSEEFSVATLNVYDFAMISVNPTDGSEWQQVSLPANGIAWKYQSPIVVMGPPSNNETDPTTIRVKGVNYNKFSFQIDEWNYLDGIHGTETISYMVMEEGVHNIEGEIWEAGSVSGVNHNWDTVNFQSGDFDEAPVVLTRTVTINETSAVVTRIRNITANSFEIKLQEEEASDGTHSGETVHYIATEARSGELDGRKFLVSKRDNYLTDEWHSIDWADIGDIESPVFIAGMQSFNDSDPCALRYTNMSETHLYLKVEEEGSEDTETEHADEENIGYLVISGLPAAPGELTADAVSESQINLTWIDNSQVEDSFKIERKQESSSFSQVYAVGPNVTSWSDTEVETGITYYYRVRAYNDDGYSGYSNEASATTGEFNKCEFDKIRVYQSGSSEWHTVNLSNTYTDPVVIMGPPSCAGDQPITVRVKDVESNEFKFQIDEWDYLDGRHNGVGISYLVMEAGVHSIGSQNWEAGKVENVNHNYTSKAFNYSFGGDQALLTEVVTCNDGSAVCTRVENLTGSSFQVKLQEEEGNDGEHPDETVHYIAVSPGTGQIDGKDFVVGKTANSVTHDLYTIDFGQSLDLPLILADMNTENEDDPAVLRYKNLSDSSVQVKVEEEQSEDSEVNHTAEVVGYLAISTVEAEPSSFKIAGDKVIYENYVRLSSPIVTGNIVLSVSSNYDRKVSVELVDIAGRVVERKDLRLKRGIEDLSLGQFKSGIYFIRICLDENNKPEVHKITVLR